MRRTLSVFLGEVLVGQLAERMDGTIEFRMAGPYVRMDERPVLGQWFEDDLTRIHEGIRPGVLPSFFANLLPEGRLRTLLERDLSIAIGDDLALIGAIGADLAGAVMLRAVDEGGHVGGRADVVPSLPHHDHALLRFSLGGVQLKFSVAREGRRITLPARGRTGDWIVKLGGDEWPGLAENEHTMLDWAQAAGFDVPDHMLVDRQHIGPLETYLGRAQYALAVRRFDRAAGKRIHQEDFAQVVGYPPTPSDRKYGFTAENLLKLVNGIVGTTGSEEAIRRLALMVATGNADAHLKNWALTYSDGAHAALSPLYDQVCTIAWPQLDRQMALKLAGTRDFGQTRSRSFRVLAQKAGLDPDGVERIALDAISRLHAAWPIVAKACPMPDDQRKLLRAHWEKVPILRETGALQSHT